jgi:NAD(P)H-dependent FMN reductase
MLSGGAKNQLGYLSREEISPERRKNEWKPCLFVLSNYGGSRWDNHEESISKSH